MVTKMVGSGEVFITCRTVARIALSISLCLLSNGMSSVILGGYFTMIRPSFSPSRTPSMSEPFSRRDSIFRMTSRELFPRWESSFLNLSTSSKTYSGMMTSWGPYSKMAFGS